MYDHQKLSQENISHINRSKTYNEIEAIKILPNKKVQDLTDSIPFLPVLYRRMNTNTP
jgi:hypothetical protein